MIDSWRDIIDDFLIVSGLTHPKYLTESYIAQFLNDIAAVANMTPLGSPIIIATPCNDTCIQMSGLTGHDYCGVQFWTTSGCTVYTWCIGKITVVVHSCKNIDYEEVKQFILSFWHIRDRESLCLKMPDKNVC